MLSNRFSISFVRFRSAMKSLFSIMRVCSSRASLVSAVWRTSDTLTEFCPDYETSNYVSVVWEWKSWRCIIETEKNIEMSKNRENQLTCSLRRSKIRLIFSSRRFAAVFNLSFRAFRSSIFCFSNNSLLRLISSAWTCSRKEKCVQTYIFFFFSVSINPCLN